MRRHRFSKNVYMQHQCRVTAFYLHWLKALCRTYLSRVEQSTQSIQPPTHSAYSNTGGYRPEGYCFHCDVTCLHQASTFESDDTTALSSCSVGLCFMCISKAGRSTYPSLVMPNKQAFYLMVCLYCKAYRWSIPCCLHYFCVSVTLP